MKWIDRLEQLPELNQKCLFYDPTLGDIGSGIYVSSTCVDEIPRTCGCTGIDFYEWTYWMPLPESPLEEYETKWGRKYREVKDNSNEMD
jgi:hypothetical protein